MIKVSIITCFESNEERVEFVKDACQAQGYEVEIYTSDFSHIRKQKRVSFPEGYQIVKTKPYRKNLSLARILSHRKYAKDVFLLIEEKKPDLIWLMAPANFLIYEAKRFRQKYSDVRLIIDMIDMWPESLPVSINKNLLPFRIWKNIRSRNLDCCDHLVCECDFYQDTLKKEYDGAITTIHWARDSKAQRNGSAIPEDRLCLCYIGSINNIIDCDKIAGVVSGFDMPVTVHVIGDGENRDHLLKLLADRCEVIYHGTVRDEDKKSEIFSQCHAGINIYKEGLYIGLTVKCIDYFEHGLPIINNISGDTWDLVEKYGAGINLTDNSVDGKKLIGMRKNNQQIYKLYEDNFTKVIFSERCLDVIDEVLK